MDPTFELEKRRNRPVKYDRDLVGATLRAMARAQEVQSKRAAAHHKNRMVKHRENDAVRARAHGVVLAVLDHAVLVVRRRSFGLNLLGPRHGAQRRPHQIPVVLDRSIPSLLELEGRVHGHLLAAHLAEGLGPADLPRVALEVEVFMAFAATKVELRGERTVDTRSRMTDT